MTTNEVEQNDAPVEAAPSRLISTSDYIDRAHTRPPIPVSARFFSIDHDSQDDDPIEQLDRETSIIYTEALKNKGNAMKRKRNSKNARAATTTTDAFSVSNSLPFRNNMPTGTGGSPNQAVEDRHLTDPRAHGENNRPTPRTVELSPGHAKSAGWSPVDEGMGLVRQREPPSGTHRTGDGGDVGGDSGLCFCDCSLDCKPRASSTA